MICVPPTWRPLAVQAETAEGARTPVAAPAPPAAPADSWPLAVVVPQTSVHRTHARSALLRSAGWRPEVLRAPAEAGSWRANAREVDRVVEEVLRSGATDVDVWACEPRPLLALVEQLWHRGIRTRVVLDASVTHPSTLTALALSAEAAEVDLRSVLEACAHADEVVADHGTPTALLARYDGPFGPIVPLRPDAPRSVPRPPRPAVLDGGLQLSVLVTTHDREDVLVRCLEALCQQSLPPSAFEVVVVDDASPRSPAPVVEAFAGRLDVRLVVLPENLGPGGARTEGLAHVRAPLTLLLDDDDLPAPRCLEEHLVAHQEHPGESVAVLGSTSVVPDGAVTALSRHVMTVGRQYFAYPSVARGDVHPWKAFWCGRSSAKTSLLRRHAFRAPLMEDADFAFRAHADGLQVVFARRAVQVVTDRLALGHFHRRQNRIGQAMLDLAERCDDDDVWTWAGLRPVMANLARWTAQRAVVRQVVDQLVVLPLDELRDTPHAHGSGLALLDAALFMELDAHYAAGMLAGLARRRADAERRPLAIGACSDDPGAIDLVEQLAACGAVRSLVGVVVARTADEAERFVAEVALRAGQELVQAAPVEVRVSALPLSSHPDVDLVLPDSLGATWGPGQPSPLIGQDLPSWLQQLARAGGPAGSLR